MSRGPASQIKKVVITGKRIMEELDMWQRRDMAGLEGCDRLVQLSRQNSCQVRQGWQSVGGAGEGRVLGF